MGTILGYLLAAALAGGTGFGVGRMGRRGDDLRSLIRTAEVLDRRICYLENNTFDRDDFEACSKEVLNGIPADTAAMIEAAIDPLRNDIEFLKGFTRGVDERMKTLITREEVQGAFAEVARATAAQQAAQMQQQRTAEAQRLLQRQQEVFGQRPVPAANGQGMPAPARPQVPSDPDQALNAQLEALNWRMAELVSGRGQA
jgi:hypothetical protein